jgi:abortive infection bacteriophage resistance protein
MAKKAITLEEQIQKLKDRGMLMDLGEDKAKEILLDIGYYRLGFYWNPFEVDEEHNFKKGTLFSNAVKLYYIDFDLRNLLLRYTNRIEINFRTKVIYHISNHYADDPIWFTNRNYMSNHFVEAIDKSLYTYKFKEDNRQINLHHQKNRNHRYAPAWKTFEYITFGSLIFAFNSIKDENLQKEIAKEYYGLNNLQTFKNFVKTIKYIRNICAHGGVLFDVNLPKGIYKIPRVKFNNNNNQSLDASIKVITYLLNEISSDRTDDFNNSVKEILFKNKDNNILNKIISDKLGYNTNIM